MGQNTYQLSFKLGKANRFGEHLVYLRYYSKGNDLLLPTAVRVEKTHFDGKKKLPIRTTHPNHKEFNTALNNFRISVESRAIAQGVNITSEYLQGSTGAKDLISAFIADFREKVKGKYSDVRVRQYKVIENKIEDFHRGARFSDVSLDWLQRLEAHVRVGVSPNTVNNNMIMVKAMMTLARKSGLIDRTQFEEYYPPKYITNLPVYLTESQIEDFYKIVISAASGPIKQAGYYFMLSCFTGYRISDLVAFVYEDRVKDGVIVLRAKKNGAIVSIPIFPRLGEILEYCKEQRLAISEQDMRDHVKTIARLAGISFYTTVKPHSGRHSFAMLMLGKGLTIDEVAELLGDSREVAKRYARITNKHLQRRVMEVMK